MANRLKLVCVKSQTTGIVGGENDYHKHVLQNELLELKLSGMYDLGLENGKEYYVDFCKVIAPRRNKQGEEVLESGLTENETKIYASMKRNSSIIGT
jgi:hypothetical protein